MGFLIGVGILVAALVVLGGIGRAREVAHIRELDDREARVAHVPVVDTETAPGLVPVHAQMVMGNAVIGTDYLKQWLSSWRTLFGGEMKSYQTVLSRARREAQIRMLEAAFDLGARAVVNVRFETSQVSGQLAAAEVLCYGTLVR
ncbi:MAG: YbjQ family protein [Acidimicrobiia bacterium]|nr:YbjQ family protein [Acidimicrobiia bacterium]